MLGLSLLQDWPECSQRHDNAVTPKSHHRQLRFRLPIIPFQGTTSPGLDGAKDNRYGTRYKLRLLGFPTAKYFPSGENADHDRRSGRLVIGTIATALAVLP